MGDADRGFHFVDILSAFATGTEGVHAQIFGPDVDLDAVVNFRNYEDGRKRSVATRCLIERRNSNETVNSGFSCEKAVSIFAGKLNGGGFDAGFFAGSFVEDDGVHALSFRPAKVHAEQDGGPVLRFGAARAGLDGHDGVEVIAFAGEERLGFQVGDVRFGGAQLAVELFEQIVALFGVGFLLREVDVRIEIAGERGEPFVGGDLFFGAFAVAQDGLGGFLIVPEIGLTDASFEGFQAFAMRSGVKDNSEPW